MTTIQDMDRVMSPQKHMVVSQFKKDMMRFVMFSILGSSRQLTAAIDNAFIGHCGVTEDGTFHVYKVHVCFP